MRKNDKKKTTIIFLTVLAVLSAASLFAPEKVFSASENRYLAQKPEFSIKELISGQYGEKYDKFLSDQFPLRDEWIMLRTLAERACLKLDGSGVYYGKDGYLIEKYQAEDFSGEKFLNNLEKIKKFTDAMGEQAGRDHVKIMLVPSASQIISDKLPMMAAPYDQEIVVSQMADKVGSDLIVPVETRLKEYKDQYIYYKTDHHWTAKGAYAGYTAWAESIGVTPLDESLFDIVTVSSEFYGTLYSKVNFGKNPDEIKLYIPKEKMEYEVFYDGSEEKNNTLYNMKALDGKDKYSVYLDGNHGLTKIINRQPYGDKYGKKLLILKDSFAHSFAPFAINHFEEVYMVDLRYFNIDAVEFAKESGITDALVLYQIPRLADN